MDFNNERVLEIGSIVDVYKSDGKTFVGRGYYNPRSQIVVRFLTRDKNEPIDASFFERRLSALKTMRESLIDTKETNAYRLVFGESDGLPGLILDRYKDVYVLQIHTAGMEYLKPLVIEAIKTVFRPKTLHERSDVGVRNLEGLKDQPNQHLLGKPVKGEIQILENGVPLLVDVVNGQKTGLFLDQRDNRLALMKYCRDKTVLNCFSYTGGFSVYAALAGATRVVSVDVAGAALETAKRNFEINDLPVNPEDFVDMDVFDYLGQCRQRKMTFDVIILDPPAFVKNQKTLEKGLAGYLRINEIALKMLPKNGVLVSSSCSAFVTDELFQKMLMLAAHRSNCILKAVEVRHQPADHPFNIDFPEGRYLKFWVCVKG